MVTQNNYFQNLNSSVKPKIIFIGSGSKLLPYVNHFNFKNFFSELIFFDESDSEICNAGINYHRSDESFIMKSKKKPKKTGFFENFFNLFSK